MWICILYMRHFVVNKLFMCVYLFVCFDFRWHMWQLRAPIHHQTIYYLLTAYITLFNSILQCTILGECKYVAQDGLANTRNFCWAVFALSLSLSRTSKHTVAETTTDYIVVWCLFFVVVCVHCHSHHFLLQGMGIPYTEWVRMAIESKQQSG